MNPIEKAIRGALEKGDAEDRAFREKVYRTVHAALEKTLQSNPDLSPEATRKRRELFKASIATIEAEFLPARRAPESTADPRPVPAEPIAPGTAIAPEAGGPVAASPPTPAPTRNDAPTLDPDEADATSAEEAPAVQADSSVKAAPAEPVPEVRFDDRRAPAAASGPAGRREPGFEPDAGSEMPTPELRAGDRAGDPSNRTAGDAPRRDGASEAPAPELLGEARDVGRGGRGRAYAAVFLAVTLLAAAGIGIWWAADQGFLGPLAGREVVADSPPVPAEEEDFDPDAAPPSLGEAGPREENWITIFTPSDPTRVTTPSGASAEIIDTDDGQVLRIVSATPDAPVMFDVGQGILEQVAGKTALFIIVARAEEGETTQISVTCNFGELGYCGRTRYTVGIERADFPFELQLPDASPGAAGTIAIASDVENSGKAVDIIEIGVSIVR